MADDTECANNGRKKLPSRTPQPEGHKGSLRWIQRAVNANPCPLDAMILPALDGASVIHWQSPLRRDDFAEYRDAAFLERIGQSHLAEQLAAFWPARGPQWDALATTDRGDVLLVEAKAHIAELCSPPSQAGAVSREKIETALRATAKHLNARWPDRWIDCFYQLTNRLAHLYFLRKHGVSAWLVLVNFLGDEEVSGPATVAEWEAAYEVVLHVLGLTGSHPFSRQIIHAYPDVSSIKVG